eukprot:TRINITY_DN24913_c0_g1_i1.p1 TRINITY_DN24913_c0_g1~~TRINITY_DN24913_c0_g1_i1.p1  ORF type:complete len:407 (+),score=53.95 TRINITY_DN24913_c0_g1_i1:26-1246(+)
MRFRVLLASSHRGCHTDATTTLSRVRIPTYQHPPKLTARLSELVEGHGVKEIRPYAHDLLQEYERHSRGGGTNAREDLRIKRKRGGARVGQHDGVGLAYSFTRMPATMAVTHRIFMELANRLPELEPESMLDFGAGTGAAIWSGLETWGESLNSVQAVEVNQGMAQMGQRLLGGEKDELVRWSPSLSGASKADVVVASYALGEIPATSRVPFVKKLWELTNQCLVLVEPGSRHGAAVIDDMRSVVLSRANSKHRKKLSQAKQGTDSNGLRVGAPSVQGAHCIAPYPFEDRCPLPGDQTWCHFVQRLQRTRLMLHVKQGTLPYEDEKFSYTVIARGPPSPDDPARHWPRIMSEPVKRKGHVLMDLVTPDQQYIRATVTKSDGAEHGYKYARKAAWGDLWPFPLADRG